MEEYRKGAVVTGWPQRWPAKQAAEHRARRGVIRSQTTRSLIRAKFAAENAETEWVAMMTLTFRTAHPNPKECLRQYLRTLWVGGANRWGVMWWQEYQRRGVVHYHVLLDAEALVAACYGDEPEWRVVGSGKSARTVLGGSHGYRLARWWVSEVGDTSDEFWRFQQGGIVESLAHAENVGSYVGSYIGKEAQKTLPDNEAPPGRWWWMAEEVKPIVRGRGTLSAYPLDKPHHLVFDKQSLLGGGTGLAHAAAASGVGDAARAVANRMDLSFLSRPRNGGVTHG